METSKLISVLTPTYNYGHLIHRLLDSILQQTYRNIEMFVVDDGSTDNTQHVLEGYAEKFKQRGFAFQAIYQENQGRSVAVNNGLKLINGDYFVFPDADDWYADPYALERMAEALDGTGDDVGCSHCLKSYVDEEKLEIIEHDPMITNEYLFEDYLMSKKGVSFGAGNYLIKTHLLFSELNERNIYAGKEIAQGASLLLPVFYKRRCIIINQHLFTILKHANSYSRKKLSYEKSMAKHENYRNLMVIIINNIKNMPEEEKDYYVRKTNSYYNTLLFTLCLVSWKAKDARTLYRQMTDEKLVVPAKIKLLYALSFIPFGWMGYRFVSKMLALCKRGARLH